MCNRQAEHGLSGKRVSYGIKVVYSPVMPSWVVECLGLLRQSHRHFDEGACDLGVLRDLGDVARTQPGPRLDLLWWDATNRIPYWLVVRARLLS